MKDEFQSGSFWIDSVRVLNKHTTFLPDRSAICSGRGPWTATLSLSVFCDVTQLEQGGAGRSRAALPRAADGTWQGQELWTSVLSAAGLVFHF